MFLLQHKCIALPTTEVHYQKTDTTNLLPSSFNDFIFFSILPVAEDIMNRSSRPKSSSMKSSTGLRGPMTYKYIELAAGSLFNTQKQLLYTTPV